MLLHHGFISSAQVNWVNPKVVRALTTAGRRVATIDARGHGESGKPHDPAYYGETRMAADVRTLIDILGEPSIDLVGYSMGVIVSLITATQEPRVRRLVIGGVGAAVVDLGGVDTRVIGRKALAAHATALHDQPIALNTITVPTLLLTGDADDLATRPDALVTAIPDATHRVVSGDHLSALRDPAFAAWLVSFLG